MEICVICGHFFLISLNLNNLWKSISTGQHAVNHIFYLGSKVELSNFVLLLNSFVPADRKRWLNDYDIKKNNETIFDFNPGDDLLEYVRFLCIAGRCGR